MPTANVLSLLQSRGYITVRTVWPTNGKRRHFMPAIIPVREIKILKTCSHVNLVQLREIVTDRPSPEKVAHTSPSLVPRLVCVRCSLQPQPAPLPGQASPTPYTHRVRRCGRCDVGGNGG